MSIYVFSSMSSRDKLCLHPCMSVHMSLLFSVVPVASGYLRCGHNNPFFSHVVYYCCFPPKYYLYYILSQYFPAAAVCPIPYAIIVGLCHHRWLVTVSGPAAAAEIAPKPNILLIINYIFCICVLLCYIK